MSASEKLKALEFGRAGFPTAQRHVGDSSVIAALPQIVAVVNGMERIKKLTADHPSQAVIFAISEATLAALDEALT